MNNALSRFKSMPSIALILAIFLLSILSSGCSVDKQSNQQANSEYSKLFPIITAKKVGFIDGKGTMIINPQFDDSSTAFSEGLCWVKVGEKYGYIDTFGNYVINPQFDYAEDFHEGLALFGLKDKFGYVDMTGKTTIIPQFDYANSFSGGMAIILVGEKYGYIDKTGKIVINPQFDCAGDFVDGLANVTLGGRAGFIDTTGKYVVNPQYYFTDNFAEGLAMVKQSKDSDVGYIDKTGKLIITPQFASGSYFSNGMACVQIGEKWGYINKSGKIIINPQFDAAFPFAQKIARVKIGEKWGYIDDTGKYLINPQFDDAEDFVNGLACTYIHNTTKQTANMSYIDTTGKTIWTLELKESDFVELGEKTAAASSYSIDTSKYIGSWGPEGENAGVNLGYDGIELTIDKIVDGMIKGSIGTFSYRAYSAINFQEKLNNNQIKFNFIDELDNQGTCVLTLEENAIITEIQITDPNQKVNGIIATERIVFNKRLGDVGSYY